MTDDLRFTDEDTLRGTMKMLTAAAALNYPTAMYAAEFNGKIVTVVSVERKPNEWVPICMLLPDEEWANVPHRSNDYPVLKKTSE